MNWSAAAIILMLGGCSPSNQDAQLNEIVIPFAELKYASQFERHYANKAINVVKCVVDKGSKCTAAKPSTHVGAGIEDMVYPSHRWTPDYLGTLQKDFREYSTYEIGPDGSWMDVPSEYRTQPGARRLPQNLIDESKTRVVVELINDRSEPRRKVIFWFKDDAVSSVYLSRTSYNTGQL